MRRMNAIQGDDEPNLAPNGLPAKPKQNPSDRRGLPLRFHPARQQPEEIGEAIQVDNDLRILQLIGFL